MSAWRQIVLTLFFSGLAGLASGAAGAEAQSVKLDIAPQPLGDALDQFAKQTGLQLIYHSRVAKGIQAPRVAGDFTPQVALGRLLDNSGLRYEYLDADTVAIFAQTQGLNGASSSDDATRLAQADAASAAAAEPAVSASRTSKGDISEIVVTAQKRVERLQDVPVPVTTVSAETLVNRNQVRLQDYYTRIPGLNLQSTPAYGEPSLAIRGLSSGAAATVVPSVGMVVDDVQYSGAGQGNSGIIAEVDPTDVARLEVLRGPQGTLYGANSIGGLLKYVTVDPSMDRISGQLRGGIFSVQNADKAGYSGNVAFNLPLGDTSAVRVSGFTRRDPGYIDDPTHNREGVNWGQSSGGRLAGLWKPSENLSLKVGALFQDVKVHADNTVDRAVGFDNLQQDHLPGTGSNHKQLELYTANLAANLGRVELTAVSSYNDVSAHFLADAAPGGPDGAAVEQSILSTKFTQEVRIAVPVGDRIEWLLGAYYATNDKELPTQVTLRDYATGAFTANVLDLNQYASFDETSAFTNLTFRWSEKFDVQVGGRQGRYKTNFASDVLPAGGPPQIGPRFSGTDEAFTYLITPRYKLSADLMLYARISSGYRTGGINVGSALTSAIPLLYSPDQTQNYEVGGKGEAFDGLLSFDASLYYIDWKDVQTELQEPVSTYSLIANSGRANSRGVELSVESKPRAGLSVAAWVTYTDAKLTEDFPATAFGAFAAAGDQLPLSSRWSGTLSLEQELAFTSAISGFFGADVSYVGDRAGAFRTSPSAARTVFPSYIKLDLHAGARYEAWEINLFGNNLTNKRAILGDTGGFIPSYFTVIQPRTFGMSIMRSF